MLLFIMGQLASIVFIVFLVAKGLLERIGIILFIGIIIHIKRALKGRKAARLLIAGILMGYLLGVIALPIFKEDVKDSYIANNYIQSNSLAVILVFQDEPSSYSFPQLLKKEIDSSKIWQYPAIPFKLFRKKLGYEKISITELNYNVALEHRLNAYFNNEFKFYSAYINKEPYLEDALYRAMKDGHGKIMISPILLTEAIGYHQIEAVIKRVNPQQYMVKVKSTMPMWDSDSIAKSCGEWINGYIPKDKRNRVGILMIGSRFNEGMEDQQSIKQEMLFRAKLKDILVEEGYQGKQITQSFLDKERITREVNELMLKGVSNIYVFQATSLYDNPLDVYNTKRIINKIDKPEGVNITYISGWQFEEGVYGELQKRIQLLIMQKWN